MDWEGLAFEVSHTRYIITNINRRLTLNAWIEQNYQKFRSDCKGITNGDPLSEELCHYVLSEFMVKPEAQSIVDSGGAFFYIIRMTLNNWNSVTSPFYRIYRQHFSELEEAEDIPDEEYDTELEILAQQAEASLQQLGWYERELFKVYLEHDSNASSVSRGTGIPRTSISLTLKHVKSHLKKSISTRGTSSPKRGKTY